METAGQGETLTYPNGDVFTGDFAYNMRNGKGVTRFTSDNIYSGDWSNDVMCGTETMKYVLGSVYTEQWANNLREGPGNLYVYLNPFDFDTSTAHANLIEK
eukprot:gene33777-41667_t